MLGYISRGFVTIVMERPGSCGLPALNDLESKKRKQHRVKKLQDKFSIYPFAVCSLLLFVSTPCSFQLQLAHTFGRRA